VKWKFAEFLARAEKELGMDLFITSGYRDMAKQEQLYSQNPSNAPAGRSYHNYGFAIDVNSNTPHLRKASSKQKWIDSGLVALGKELGMKWGGDFHSYHDPVHFVFKPKDIDTLQAYYNTGHVDRNGYVKV
jgi:peptidoglycan L-alanyl-D-glutamate endopeptidase CwlK